MPARLHTLAALLALFALALPAGATAATALGLCGIPCEEPAPCAPSHEMPGHEMPGHEMPGPDAPMPEAPAQETADCCIALDGPIGTEVIVPEAQRPADLPRVLLPSVAPVPPFRAPQAPERLPAPGLRTHLAFSVLLI